MNLFQKRAKLQKIRHGVVSVAMARPLTKAVSDITVLTVVEEANSDRRCFVSSELGMDRGFSLS
jgi:hypothetical protein